MKKTKLMQQVERARQQPLEQLLPDMVNARGLAGTADALGVSRATVNYWLLKLGVDVRRVAIAHNQQLEIRDRT